LTLVVTAENIVNVDMIKTNNFFTRFLFIANFPNFYLYNRLIFVLCTINNLSF